MKYKSLVLYTVFIVAFFFIQNANAAPYGSSTYGSGVYGTGVSTTTSTSTSTTSTTTHTSTTGTKTCAGAAPSAAPNLFQVDRTSSKATLYFAPAGNPNNHYVIAYGPRADTLIYGVQFDQGSVPYALTYTIDLLNPKSDYAFTIRGGNGCATGAWSSTVITKRNTVKNRIVSYYPGFAPRIKYLFTQLTKSKPVTVADPKKIIKGSGKTSLLKTQPMPKQVNVLGMVAGIKHWFDSLTNVMKRPT